MSTKDTDVEGNNVNVNATESTPLLQQSGEVLTGEVAFRGDGGNGEAFDAVPQAKRQIGLISAVFLIFNRVIGTGIYATPGLILRSCGSVGMSLTIWIVGAAISFAGTAVFIELGTGLPRSGGEKNYLEFIYRRPKFLVTCVYAMFAFFTAWSAANAVIFGEYVVHAFSLPVTLTNTRIIGVLSLTIAFLLHATQLKAGLMIQNALGIFMLSVLLFIAIAGLLSLLHTPGFTLDPSIDPPQNLSWSHLWTDTRLDANAFVSGLYNVIYSFIGYSNANYALSEVKDPVKTIKRAAPLAMISITIVYLLVNVAYFAVVSKKDILDSGQVVAALFFRNLYGIQTERIVSLIIALSVFGNILAVMFTQGRVIQELGREGILPYSSWFASNWPYNAPFVGLFAQWVVCCITAAAPPPGDAFHFILNLSSYPLSVINTFVALGVLFLHTRWSKSWDWTPPYRSWTSVTFFFLVSNIFLTVVPFVPPAPGYSVYDHLPYWLHAIVSLAIGASGGVYWYVRCVYLPRRGGYRLVRQVVVQEDGVPRNTFQKVGL